MTRLEMANQTSRVLRRYQQTLQRGLTMYDDREHQVFARLPSTWTEADFALVASAVSREERQQGRSRRSA